MSYLTTLQQLKTILDTVSASVLPIKFQYQEAQPTSFPAGVLLYLGGGEQMIDTITNQVTEQFIIRLIFPVEASQAAAEKHMTLVDTIGNTFRSQSYQTLGGNAISFMIKNFAAPVGSNEYGSPVLVFDINVEARVLKVIT